MDAADTNKWTIYVFLTVEFVDSVWSNDLNDLDN